MTAKPVKTAPMVRSRGGTLCADMHRRLGIKAEGGLHPGACRGPTDSNETNREEARAIVVEKCCETQDLLASSSVSTAINGTAGEGSVLEGTARTKRRVEACEQVGSAPRFTHRVEGGA